MGKLLEEIKEIVDKYSNESLTSEEINQLRHDLSVKLFYMTDVGGPLDKAHREANQAETWYNKTKSDAYKRSLENEAEGSSTKAEKLYRKDKEYNKASYNYNTAKSKVSRYNRFLTQANQILHSMASKTRD